MLTVGLQRTTCSVSAEKESELGPSNSNYCGEKRQGIDYSQLTNACSQKRHNNEVPSDPSCQNSNCFPRLVRQQHANDYQQ